MPCGEVLTSVNGMVRPSSCPASDRSWPRVPKPCLNTHHRDRRIRLDIDKDSFHVVGLDQRGAIVLRQKRSRGQVNARFANMPPCLIGREACVVAHHLSRELKAFVTTWTYEEPRTACVCLRHRLAREHRSFPYLVRKRTPSCAQNLVPYR